MKQVLSNTAQEYHNTMVQAYRKKNLTVFDDYSTRFFRLIGLTEQVLARAGSSCSEHGCAARGSLRKGRMISRTIFMNLTPVP